MRDITESSWGALRFLVLTWSFLEVIFGIVACWRMMTFVARMLFSGRSVELTISDLWIDCKALDAIEFIYALIRGSYNSFPRNMTHIEVIFGIVACWKMMTFVARMLFSGRSVELSISDLWIDCKARDAIEFIYALIRGSFNSFPSNMTHIARQWPSGKVLCINLLANVVRSDIAGRWKKHCIINIVCHMTEPLYVVDFNGSVAVRAVQVSQPGSSAELRQTDGSTGNDTGQDNTGKDTVLKDALNIMADVRYRKYKICFRNNIIFAKFTTLLGEQKYIMLALAIMM